MRSVGFPHLAIHIARKDWSESRRMILTLTAALLVPAFLTRLGPPDAQDFATGLLAGLLAGTGFGYAQYCFANERQRGTLELLLSLPISPPQIAAAKYVSLYSMVLFTVSVPVLIIGDFRVLVIANLAASLLATVFMGATVVSAKPWAPQLPLYVLLVAGAPLQLVLRRFAPDELALLGEIVSGSAVLPVLAAGLVPGLAAVSVYLFSRNQRLNS